MSSAFGAAFGGFFPRRSKLFIKKPDKHNDENPTAL
jgi:hypothetical protein